MAFRLLVADVDGTLLTSDRRVPPGVCRAIRAVQEHGVRVCLATGRMWRSAAPFVEAAGADPPVILYNGAQIFDFRTGEVLYRKTLRRELARAALEVLARFPEVQPHLFVEDRAYVAAINPLTLEYARKDGIPVTEAGDLLACLRGEPVKILIVGDRARLEEVARAFAATGQPIEWVFSEPTYLEVLPEGVSKGEAVRWLAARLGVPREEVVAVGDNLNDLSMIRYAGLGVAMATAPEALRREARYVAPSSDQEGLRDVLERWILADRPGREAPGRDAPAAREGTAG